MSRASAEAPRDDERVAWAHRVQVTDGYDELRLPDELLGCEGAEGVRGGHGREGITSRVMPFVVCAAALAPKLTESRGLPRRSRNALAHGEKLQCAAT